MLSLKNILYIFLIAYGRLRWSLDSFGKIGEINSSLGEKGGYIRRVLNWDELSAAELNSSEFNSAKLTSSIRLHIYFCIYKQLHPQDYHQYQRHLHQRKWLIFLHLARSSNRAVKQYSVVRIQRELHLHELMREEATTRRVAWTNRFTESPFTALLLKFGHVETEACFSFMNSPLNSTWTLSCIALQWIFSFSNGCCSLQ